MNLHDFFLEHPKAAVAFSGGADSAYLLHAAKQHRVEMQAYFVKAAFQPSFERDDARRFALKLDIPLKIIPLDILADGDIAANPPNRCYHCKKHILTAILAEAGRDGFPILLDGTNASDDADDRPGMAALQELGILSPLRLCGLSKADIRRLSREDGLSTWNKPAYSCLATRIPTHQPITDRLLQRTEAAEAYLRSLGFHDFRVRTDGESAKIQITEQDYPLLTENRVRILERLRKDYSSVWLDLEARNEH